MVARGLLLALALSVGSGCDIVVSAGEERVLGHQGRVLGVERPNAVLVQEGGSLVVEDAEVIGRGVILERVGTDFPQPGAAIVSNLGSVRIQQGLVAGGNAIGTDAANQARIVFPLAPALVAIDSEVEISGGTLVSGGAFGLESFFLPPTLMQTGGRLRITGGRFLRGPRPVTPDAGTVRVDLATVEISGGSFGRVELRGSSSVIRGGDIGLLLSGDRDDPIPERGDRTRPNPPGGDLPIQLATEFPPCTDIRGGTFQVVQVDGGRVFIFGTSFNRPFGTLPRTSVDLMEVTGTYADGSPIDLDLWIFGGDVTLARPEAAGCVEP